MSLFVLRAIFKRTAEAFSQTASKGEPVLPFPPSHDEKKEWVGIFLRKKNVYNIGILQYRCGIIN